MGLATEKIRWATFDCYGTLIDWEGGAASFLYELARRHEPAPPPAQELRDRWEALQFERLRGEWRNYRSVLADSLSELTGQYGWRWNARDGEALARAMESWQPFPDTVPALRAARDAGMGLWIISNCDRAIMEHSLRQMDVDFDGVTVAEDCRAYKPSRAPFERALGEIGVPPQQILHVAFGFKYDIAPAQQLGMRSAWVNRRQEPAPGDARPDHEWSDLWPLAGLASTA